MKRRRSSAHLIDPQTVRNFSSRGIIDEVQPSHNRFDTTKYGEDEDIQVVNRVKFRDPGTSKLPNFGPDISPVQNKATQSPRSDLPKTSEYAFFKKVKKNARGHSYPLQKNNNRLNDGELNECTKEILDKAKQSYKDLRPSLPVEKSKPINQESLFSPLAGVSKSQAVINMENPTSKGIRSPPFVEKVKSTSDYFLSSPFSGGSKKEGNQFSKKGVFSTRRQRLRRWISNLLPQLDESCSEGVDLADVLLSRLFPENNENHYRLDSSLRQVQTDTKHSPTSFASVTRNSIGSEHGSDLDDMFYKYGSNRPRYIVIPEFDTPGSDYASTFQDKYSKPLIKSSYPERDPFHDLPYPKYKSITWHLKKLDEFHEPNTPVLKEEPQTLLIGWDFKNEKEEQEPSIMSNNTEMNLFSWGNYYPQNVRDKLNASTLCSSSLFSNNSLYPFLDFPPDHHFRSYLLGEKYQISQSPKYLKMVDEDSISDCQLDFGLGFKCLSVVDSLTEHYSSSHHEISEDTLIPNDWPIINFQIPCDVEMSPVICPLLLDNSDWTQSEEEIYRDDNDDDEWKYI